MKRWCAKLGLCLLPPALVPLAFFSLAEGWITLGGGEKDIILIFPFAIWAVIYAISFAVLWIRRNDTRRCVKHAALIATIPLVCAWLALFAWLLTR